MTQKKQLNIDDGERNIMIERRGHRVHISEDIGNSIAYEIGSVAEETDDSIKVLVDAVFQLDHDLRKFSVREELADQIQQPESKYMVEIQKISAELVVDR